MVERSTLASAAMRSISATPVQESLTQTVRRPDRDSVLPLATPYYARYLAQVAVSNLVATTWEPACTVTATLSGLRNCSRTGRNEPVVAALT